MITYSNNVTQINDFLIQPIIIEDEAWFPLPHVYASLGLDTDRSAVQKTMVGLTPEMSCMVTFMDEYGEWKETIVYSQAGVRHVLNSPDAGPDAAALLVWLEGLLESPLPMPDHQALMATAH